MLTKYILAVVLLGYIGCSLTLPVRGQIENSPESFTGTATGYMNGSGTMKLISTSGVTCEGEFVYESSRTGSGVLRASDGRTGSFTFASTGRNGTGTGLLGGKKFIFTFGKMARSEPPGEAPKE